MSLSFSLLLLKSIKTYFKNTYTMAKACHFSLCVECLATELFHGNTLLIPQVPKAALPPRDVPCNPLCTRCSP